MSAGICIMNKNAIALAADSAVTIGSHLAIHNSANKLFSLSKIAPVGVLIYANADFMSIPFEIIFKQYKKELGNKTLGTLQEYVDNFFAFLIEKKELFRFEQNEKNLIIDICDDVLRGMYGDYQALLQKKIKDVKRDLTNEELEHIQTTLLNITYRFIDRISDITHFQKSDYIIGKYLKNIQNKAKFFFPWLKENDLLNLSQKICKVYDKDFFRNGYTGLAFAGYGDNSIFPEMIHINISGIIDNTIRYKINENVRVNEISNATITPLAQTDVMQTFLFGINDSFIEELGKEMPRQIQKCLQDMDDSFFQDGKKSAVQCELNNATSNIINQIINKAQKQYLNPITQAVASLPIEELALLAESMINITSLRRKVALDNNIGTVGGPIDVAIISKGDGFIWMKRKHYFDKEYNPQYFFSHFLLSGGDNNGNSANE